jgi:hypothetical protein
VFQRSLRPIFLLLMALLAREARAGAAPDIDDVTLDITVERSTSGGNSFRAELRVIGTSLVNGTIALPSNPGTQLALSQDGDDLVWDDDFATEAQLDAAFPNGNYVLRVNNGTAQSTINYTRPSVPSPAISQPSGVVPPGPVEVSFTRCSVCSLGLDSVRAVLEDDAMTVLDEEILDEDADSWVPQDVGGDLELPEASAFVARVVHTAIRDGNVPVAGNDADGTLVFTGTEIQSSEVDFETGFNPPAGRFCLATNYTGPPAGCTLVNDAALQLLDTSGTFATTVDGHDVDYTVDVDAAGRLSGMATADLDDNTVFETGPSPIKGSFKSKAGEAASKVAFSLVNEALAAKLKLSIADALSVAGNTLDREQNASGSLGGAKIKETTSSSGALPFTPLGWLLEFDLAADGTVTNAVFTLENARSFPLEGSGKFKIATNESGLKLQSDPKGIQVQLKGLVLDDAVDPMDVLGGALSYRALGQSGRRDLP